MDKNILDHTIQALEDSLKNGGNKDIINYQLKGLYELKQQNNKKSNSKNGITKKKLEEEKETLFEKKEEIKATGTAEEYINILKEIKKINKELRELKNEIHFLTDIELKRFKAAIRKNAANGEKYLLMILIGFECGLRVTELINLKLNDISLENKTILCRRLKGSNTNTIILTENTLKLLTKFLKKSDSDLYVFTNRKGMKYTSIAINKMFKLYCSKARIPRTKQRFHTLKHTRAVHLANEGLTLQQIQHMLGHKSINSTMVYFQFTKTQEEDIYNKLKGYQ